MSSGGSTANIHPSNPRLEAIATRLEAIPYFWGYYKGPSMALQYQDWAVRLVSFDQFPVAKSYRNRHPALTGSTQTWMDIPVTTP